MTVGHIMSGPLDALIELGLPLLVFAGLWWWSSRAGRRARKDRERKE